MPESHPPSIPASGEDILRTMLPVVVEAVTKSAEGHTASATTIQALESQVAELKAAVQANTAEVKRVNDYRKAELRNQEENGKWLRSLFKPETVYYTIVLLLTAFGIRATIPAPVQIPLTAPGNHAPLPGDLP